ncbi:MAG: DUF1329 domain-containing protein [Deltaproteobacteria bacterium]|nr:DUF1329 domain-containing protein [Deltaproteobacteria bacterium]
MRTRLGRRLWPLVCVFAALAAPLSAQVRPGETIGRKDAERVRELVSPGVLWLLGRGMEMRIIARQPCEDPPAYRAATEKYSAQVRLRPDGVLDESTYVAGRPFPTIDPNDPQAATKIMYNVERTRAFTDDVTARLLDAETGSIARTPNGGQTFRVERHFVLDALRVLRYVGRTETAPVPALPNPDGVLAKAGQYPVLEPFDLKGAGVLGYRYLDAGKQDDTWIYLPSLRRARRLSSVQRSDALFAQDVDIDSYGGYAGRIPRFRWKLLGEKPMLASRHGERLPPAPCPGDGGVTFCESWEPLPRMWVIEGTPQFAGYAYSKRVIFVDDETFLIAYTDLYGESGELWKVAINHRRHARKPNPNAALEYPFARDFLYGFVVVDTQLHHATRAALPGVGFPKEPGWYVNQGDRMDAGEDWFTVDALIQ